MKIKIILFAILVVFFKANYGQDTGKEFEFGSTLITANVVNNYNSYPDLKPVEYVNGLFFRCMLKKRVSLRVLMSYSENYHYYFSPPGISKDASGGQLNKDIRMGIGGQYSFFKNNSLLYSFLDISYRNVFSYGHIYGSSGLTNILTLNTNGAFINPGLGSKIKINKSIYMSPEITFNYFTGNMKIVSTDCITGNTNKYSSQKSYWNPVIRLNLTVKL